MIFGTESFQTGQELLCFVSILEFIRLNLLTLVYIGMDIMDSPNQSDLPLWTNQKTAERTVRITNEKKERSEDKATAAAEDIPPPYDYVV